MDDNTPRDLARLVLDKIAALGEAEAVEYFGVSKATLSHWRTGKNLPSLEAAQKVWSDSLLCQCPEVWGNAANATVQFLLPAYTTIEPLFFVTLFRSCKLYGVEKVNIIPKMRTLIVEARNDLIAKALLTKSEWFIFGDADSVLPCGSGSMLRGIGLDIPEPMASFNAIDRLMSHPKEHRIVGAMYKDRRGGNKVQCEAAFRSTHENERLLGIFSGKNKPNGLEKMGWTGFGLVRVHRSVFEEMVSEASKPGSLLSAILPPPPPRHKEPFGFFGRSARFRGEDIYFCRHAEMIGIHTYVDTGLLLGHIGSKIY